MASMALILVVVWYCILWYNKKKKALLKRRSQKEGEKTMTNKESEIVTIEEPMYAIHQYTASGKHIRSYYRRTLADAIEIRNEIIRSHNIEKKPWLYPTIWKEGGDTFVRVTGF